MYYLSIVLAVASVLLYVGGLVRFFGFSDKRRTTKRLLDLTIAIVAAVLAYKTAERIAANQYQFPSGVLIELMQSFSLDADYSNLLDPFPGTSGVLAWLTVFFKVILFSSAPIAGGAVIYDVLAGVSPELRLLLLRKRKLLIFSELNEKTVTLAENLVKQKQDPGAFAVVFTDCYLSGDEESSELSMRAKNLRAVCLQADLLHCDGFQHSADCSFFLMDEDETGNLDDNSNLISLRGLLNLKDPVWNRARGCTITMFTNSSETIENARALKKAFEQAEKEQKAEADKEKNAPKSGTQTSDKFESAAKLHVIRDLAAACCRHLNEEPLFDELEEPGQPLDVVIFGNTPFAAEMFRSVFWCGQLLDHPLRISVVAPPEEGSGGEPPLLGKLRRLNPELLESCQPGDPCLQTGLDEDPAPIYASLCFIAEDPTRVPLRDFLKASRRCQYGDRDSFALKDATRFFVMLGSDEENVALADELRRALIYLRNTGAASGKMAISAAVENADLSKVVKERFGVYCQQDTRSQWLKLHLFGGFQDRYCRDIVTFDSADLIGPAEQRELVPHALKDISATSDDIYNEWSRVARAYHRKYKLFSAGEKESEITRDEDMLDKVLCLRQDLCWLEHRRWCAFLRAEGFSQPAGLYEQLRIERTQYSQDELWQYANKNVPSRLHPCLVECRRAPAGKADPDPLDLVGRLRERLKGKELSLPKWPMVSAIKSYDYPKTPFGPSVSREELQALWEKLRDLFPVERQDPCDAAQWLQEHPELKETKPGSGLYPLVPILNRLEKDSQKR